MYRLDVMSLYSNFVRSIFWPNISIVSPTLARQPTSFTKNFCFSFRTMSRAIFVVPSPNVIVHVHVLNEVFGVYAQGPQSTEKRLIRQCALFKRCFFRRTHRFIEVCRIRRKLVKLGTAPACHRHSRRQGHRHCHHHMEMKRSRYRAFTAKVCQFPCQSSHESRLLVTLI